MQSGICAALILKQKEYTEIYIRLLIVIARWKLQSMGKANKAEWFSVDVFLVGCGSERCKMEGIYIEIGGGGAQWG